MIARNRIWEEMKQAKANVSCLLRYTDIMRRWNRWYDFFIAISASIGALGSIYSTLVPIITSIVVAFVSIVKSLIPKLLQTETELFELDKLSDFYNDYLNSLEYLWYNYFNEFVNEEDTMKQFFELKEKECPKMSAYNRGVRFISKKMQDKIDKESKEYINRVYFTKEESKAQ